ncbi:hypothetical protein [Sulfurimonas sp. HSL3-7]|uniref:hypothetical protein n=1 Tax=Sulfonitrofixus jiaomeiensis TaxID=3131938 RepID=UPI0031F85FB0
MKSFVLPLLFGVFFAACSQESAEEQHNEQIIKVEKIVEKSSDKDGALICLEENEKIICKLMTKRANSERSVKFNWFSPTSPRDDRERTFILPANHASLFDSRNKEGRAKGRWTVTVGLDSEKISTTFTLR